MPGMEIFRSYGGFTVLRTSLMWSSWQFEVAAFG